MNPTRARRPAAAVPGALLLGALALAACGKAGAPEPVTAGAPVAGPPAPAVAAPASGPGAPPTLPPVQQRDPQLFDERGCPRTGPDTASCSTTAADIDRAAATPGAGQHLAGYVGGSWATAAPTGRVTVLEDTVSTAVGADGHWSATGLARNEQAGAIAGATVHVDLLGADGAVLETVSAEVPVHPLRSGEPAPFTLVAATTTPAQVVSVRWAGEAATTAGPVDGSTRQLELQTYWTRRPDDARRIDNYLFHDPVGSPPPLVLFGSATALGPGAVAHPHVVAAWSDSRGRVVLVRDVPLSISTGAAAETVAGGGAADFLVAVPTAELPSAVDLATAQLWGFGS